MKTTLTVLVGALAVALAACGSSSKSSAGTPTSSGGSGTTLPASTEYGQGVTANSIKIGVALVDFVPIQSFIDFNHGDEERTDKIMIDDVNKHGGIDGKQITAVYKKYTPIGSTFPTQVCTSMTEDQKVFAVLGNIEDPTGAAQLCVSKQHHTILIGHDMTDAELLGADPNGLMLTPDITAERRLEVLLSLMKQQNTLQGKTVGILAETPTKARATDIVEPALKDMGVKTGTTGVMQINGTDQTLAQQQLDSFIEKWKGEGVNAVIVLGADAVAKQFVTKVAAGLPGVLLATDGTSSASGAAQDEVAAHVNPNPYDGMLTANGLTDQAMFETPEMQKCVKVYEDATGETVVAPKDLKPGPDGKRVQVYVAIADICRELTLFKAIAAKAGTYLNNDNWVNAVNSLGPITGMAGSQYASLSTGKYSADDSFALSEFDPSVNDFKNITPIMNEAG